MTLRMIAFAAATAAAVGLYGVSAASRYRPMASSSARLPRRRRRPRRSGGAAAGIGIAGGAGDRRPAALRAGAPADIAAGVRRRTAAPLKSVVRTARRQPRQF